MGIGDHGILAVGKDINLTAIETVSAMMDDESEVISVYTGMDISQEASDQLNKKLEEMYPDCEIEFNPGGQPVYYYIISVE